MPIQDSDAVLTSTLRDRFRHTAICVFEKNYRLQDIQLSKNPPLLPSAAPARQAQVSARRISYFDQLLACRTETSLLRSLKARRRLVENTGLEPVTSWLQTRRSPS